MISSILFYSHMYSSLMRSDFSKSKLNVIGSFLHEALLTPRMNYTKPKEKRGKNMYVGDSAYDLLFYFSQDNIAPEI